MSAAHPAMGTTRINSVVVPAVVDVIAEEAAAEVNPTVRAERVGGVPQGRCNSIRVSQHRASYSRVDTVAEGVEGEVVAIRLEYRPAEEEVEDNLPEAEAIRVGVIRVVTSRVVTSRVGA